MAEQSSLRSLLNGNSSLSESIASLPRTERLKILEGLDPEALQSWAFWARAKQILPEGDWRVWLILAGRGFGKTRTGAETVLYWCRDTPGTRVALVARTAADVRDVMIDGESGLLSCALPADGCVYEPSRRLVSFGNGSECHAYSADEAKQLRGPQHGKGWADELAQWPDPDTWDQLKFGMRLGLKPQIVVTTTPRPIDLIRNLRKDRYTFTTSGSTFENEANLPASFIHDLRFRYEGTRLGRQELEAEVLDEVPGAFWTHKLIDDCRAPFDEFRQFIRIEIGVDPSGGETEEHDEQGIVVCGRTADGHCYVLDDASCKLTPDGWGRRVVEMYTKWNADAVIWESNFGGQMVDHVVRTAAKAMQVHLVTREVKASRGKSVRAEPVSVLYEQKRMHHIGSFPQLEDQLCCYTPQGYSGSNSPDRGDALVWAASSLMLGSVAPSYDGIKHVIAHTDRGGRRPVEPAFRRR